MHQLTKGKKPQETPAPIRPALWLCTLGAPLLLLGLIYFTPQSPPREALASPELARLHTNTRTQFTELNIARRKNRTPDPQFQIEILKQMSDDRATWIDGIENF